MLDMELIDSLGVYCENILQYSNQIYLDYNSCVKV